MRTETAKDLAEELECESVDDAFIQFVDVVNDNDGIGKIGCMGLFKSLCATSQKQLLKFCSDNNDTDAYNFYHSLI